MNSWGNSSTLSGLNMPNGEFNLPLLEAGLSKVIDSTVCFEEQGGDISDLHSWTLVDSFLDAEQESLGLPRHKMGLQVKTVSGKTILVDVGPLQTVGQVKRVIEVEEGIPAEDQILALGGEVLRDASSLQESGVLKERSVQLVFRLRGGSNQLLIKKQCLAPQYDYDFTSMEDDGSIILRGGEVYTRPFGWYRYALKVRGKYGDDAWLGVNRVGSWSCSGEWPVAYHGTHVANGASIVQVGYDLSASQRKLHGVGIYTSPNISIAESYAPKFDHNGKTYKLVLQNRVNPRTLKKFVMHDSPPSSPKQIWLSEANEDVRAYGILIKKVSA